MLALDDSSSHDNKWTKAMLTWQRAFDKKVINFPDFMNLLNHIIVLLIEISRVG